MTSPAARPPRPLSGPWAPLPPPGAHTQRRSSQHNSAQIQLTAQCRSRAVGHPEEFCECSNLPSCSLLREDLLERRSESVTHKKERSKRSFGYKQHTCPWGLRWAGRGGLNVGERCPPATAAAAAALPAKPPACVAASVVPGFGPICAQYCTRARKIRNSIGGSQPCMQALSPANSRRRDCSRDLQPSHLQRSRADSATHYEADACSAQGRR